MGAARQQVAGHFDQRFTPEFTPRQMLEPGVRRHLAQLKKGCNPGEGSCRPRQRQALLHWAYDTRFI